MATGFDGLGLGMLGSERSYMNADNPLRTALHGLKDFGIMYGMEKAGLFDMLNKAGQAKKDMMAKYPGMLPDKTVPGAAAPVAPAAAVAPPSAESDADVNVTNPLVVPSAVAPPNQVPQRPTGTPIDQPPEQNLNPDLLQKQADHSMGLSLLNPDTFKPRDTSQDAVAAEMAVAPPPMQLPQYGHQGGGGINPMSVISSLASLLA